MPEACPQCDNEEVRFFAMVPAKTTYEGNDAFRRDFYALAPETVAITIDALPG